ncbi:MAG: dTMP kinase [Chloroflexi bacterium]|nr:dTMP kinase [Chloroflexota bacterium]
MSLFVSFEGGEGSGKTTQVDLLTERIRDAGVSCVVVREPGTTALGWYLRDWLKRGALTGESPSDEAELFLFAAARAELVSKIIKPELAQAGTVVVADRYADSTLAYQGHGRGIPKEHIDLVNEIATQGVDPDMTFLLDCPPEAGFERVGALQLSLPLDLGLTRPRARRDEEGTHFEAESLEFHRRVRDGYLEILKEDPARWTVIDATKPADEIGQVIWDRVRPALPGVD